MTSLNKSFEERFWEKVDKNGENGCWNWVGSKVRGGYGHIKRGNSYPQSHRVSFELIKGEIPKGKLLDHLCRNPACVNPDHLEPVSARENLLRGVGIPSNNACKTHCPKGHEYTEENTSISKKGQRNCKECVRIRSNEWRRKQGIPEGKRRKAYGG